MPRYIRSNSPGASYFFTVVLLERQRTLLTDHISSLRDAFRAVRSQRLFSIDAMVVLPEHLHCIWTLPPGDADFSNRWRLIKTRFSRSLPSGEWLSPRRERKSERGMWQRRFWERLIRDEQDFAAHVDYIHYNPVRHGLVERVADWPYSSFHRYVQKGVFPENWAAGVEIKGADWE
jgi:putative transposase